MQVNTSCMKKFICSLSITSILFSVFLVSCDSVNNADIERLISPAALPLLKNSKLIQVSSHDLGGGNDDFIVIPAGKKARILDVEGPGMITRIWFALNSPDPYFLRRILIRIYWNNEKNPSVEVPFGDFFGNGFAYQPYISQYLGMTGGGYICYFPMPFEVHARIEIVNETMRDIPSFSYQINYHKFEGVLDRNVAYFHAHWTRDMRTDYDSNYTLLRTKGNGHIVGLNLNIQSYSGNFDFLDGDEMIYVDGEKKPGIYGTGTEHFFSGTSHFKSGEFSGSFSGLSDKNDSLGRISAYRFYVSDPIPFRRSVKLTFEHGHGNQSIADYSSTVYWYQSEPHHAFPSMPKAGQRIPLRIIKPKTILEAETLKFDLKGLQSKVMDMSDFGADWGNNQQLFISAHVNSVFQLTLSGLKEAIDHLTIFYTKGPSYANVDIYVNGSKAGEIKGYAPVLLPDGIVLLENLNNQGKSLDLRFVVSGKDPIAYGYDIGIDGILLQPKRNYIPEWYLLGPFPNQKEKNGDRKGLDIVFAPELENFDTNRVFTGINGKPIRWKYVQTPEDGYLSLMEKMRPHEMAVVYATSFIYAITPDKVGLYVGSDDGMKIFFNNKEVYRFSGIRVAEPDQAEIMLNIKPGWNKLLLKIENNYGGFGFYARISGLENNIRTIANQRTLTPLNE